MYICLQTFNTSLLRLKIANTEITVERLHIHYAFQGLAFRIGLPQNTSSPSASNRTIKQKFDKCKLQLRKQSSYKRSLYGTLVKNLPPKPSHMQELQKRRTDNWLGRPQAITKRSIWRCSCHCKIQLCLGSIRYHQRFYSSLQSAVGMFQIYCSVDHYTNHLRNLTEKPEDSQVS